MKLFLRFFIIFILVFSSGILKSQTLDEYIKKAGDFQKSYELDKAVNIMSEAVKKYPKKADAYSYLGLYIGMQAGTTKDFMEAGKKINKSFEMFDKAVLLDPKNPTARFHRGLMGVNIPEFLGKLDSGIKDLEFLIEITKESPKKVSKDILISSYNFLAKGYQKKKEKKRAILAWKKVIELAPGSDLAIKAEENIKEISKVKIDKKVEKRKPDSPEIAGLKKQVKNEPNNSALLIKLSKAYVDKKDFEEARKILKEAIKIDSKNIKAYKLLIFVIGELAVKGYDERIYEDTDLRTNLAFELMRFIDKACALSPDDVEIRLLRGITGVEMPFFVNKLEQAIEDLKWISKRDVSESYKAKALFWLGKAYQKKAMIYWIKVVSKYPKTEASKYVFSGLHPKIKRLNISKYKMPVITIDFLLGFRDELAPQTVVWIENKEGKFIKTIYVSGFSGYAKEHQINLPKWSKSSNFVDVDGVTSASIDLGHHIYVWDLKDISGKKVNPGEYLIKVEVSHWPSMEYQLVSAAINIGKDKDRVVIEQGDLIPYLEVKYYPK